MNKLFDRLNLQPGERRLMIVLLMVLFVLANMWFVWPHFKDWREVQNEIASARNKRELYRLEINRTPDLEANLQSIQNRIGTNVFTSDSAGQRLRFGRAIDKLAQETSTRINRRGQISDAKPQGSRTNQFFTELSMSLRSTSSERELVEFLYRLGTDESRVRVRDLTINPSRTGTTLDAQMTLVASFLKNPKAEMSAESAGN